MFTGGRINLDSDEYVCEPDSDFGSVYNPDLVSYHDIFGFPCLVLLGEPGIGKRAEMREDEMDASGDSRILSLT